MPSWFPFPIEIPRGEVSKEVKKKTAPKAKSLIPEEEKPKPQPKAQVKEKAMPTVIEVQENRWRAQEVQGFAVDKQAVVNGIIWSEILGPPKSKRRFNYR